MTVAARNGWGWISNLTTVAQTAAGVNSVVTNNGVGAQVQAAGRIRLSKICYRVDMSPDVAVGVVSSPTQYRLVVLAGSQLPPDVSGWQASQFGSSASHPEIPQTSPLEVLFDLWLEFAANDPGLNELTWVDFADSGPTVPAGATLMVILVPMNTAMSQAVVPVNGTKVNAQLTLGVYGLGDSTSPQGGSSATQMSGASLPRYDVSVDS